MLFIIIDFFYLYTNHDGSYNDINSIDFLNKLNKIFIYKWDSYHKALRQIVEDCNKDRNFLIPDS